MKYIPSGIVALALAACAHAPITADKAAQRQADFTAVCKYAAGAWQIAKPIAATPVLAAKLGDSGVLAVKAVDAFVTTTCSTPLDINNADAIIQRGYDIAGQVIALVIQATAT